jgi:hypothetical protein
MTHVIQPRNHIVRARTKGHAGKWVNTRTEPRYRAHLRGGRIFDAEDDFVATCLICDRSARGARLRLPASIFVPVEIIFYDDGVLKPVRAQVRWRRNDELGIFTAEGYPGSSPQEASLVGRAAQSK